MHRRADLHVRSVASSSGSGSVDQPLNNTPVCMLLCSMYAPVCMLLCRAAMLMVCAHDIHDTCTHFFVIENDREMIACKMY